MYSDDLEFVWDQRKSEANLALRGFDFLFATLIFSGATVERADDRRDYGEPRFVAVGVVNGICLTVVYTDRCKASGGIERRIISARLSNRKERMVYEAASRKNHT
jgi:uncharacterized DUF497 family protein